jgi:hypothetical protein
MKKNIKTYEELLTSLALSGDSAAFHSLIEPILRSYYVKMISEGMKHGEVSEKLCEKAASLYKSFLVSGKNSIDSISDSEFEKSNGPTGETDFLQSNVVNEGEQQFSRELMHSLQQFKRRYKGKFRNVRTRSYGFTLSKRTWLFTVSIVAIIAGVFIYLYLVSSGGFDVQIVKKSDNGLNGSLKKKNDTSVKQVDVSLVHDTLKKETSKDSILKADTLSKPKLKPRRALTETPQATGSAEIQNAFDASPVVQPKISREQSTQAQTPSDAGSSMTQPGGSENSTRSSPPAVAPQPSTQSQDSSWGF